MTAHCMQADIYSFGMLMLEIVTGAMPWERMTVGQIFFAVVQQDARPAVPETLPAGYKSLMEVRPGLSSLQAPPLKSVLLRRSAAPGYSHRMPRNVTGSSPSQTLALPMT